MFKPIRALAIAGAVLSLASVAAAAEPPPGAFAEVQGGRIWYETCGSGPQAIVLSLDRCGLYNPGDRAARAGAGPRFLLGDRAADFEARR